MEYINRYLLVWLYVFRTQNRSFFSLASYSYWRCCDRYLGHVGHCLEQWNAVPESPSPTFATRQSGRDRPDFACMEEFQEHLCAPILRLQDVSSWMHCQRIPLRDCNASECILQADEELHRHASWRTHLPRSQGTITGQYQAGWWEARRSGRSGGLRGTLLGQWRE